MTSKFSRGQLVNSSEAEICLYQPSVQSQFHDTQRENTACIPVLAPQ